MPKPVKKAVSRKPRKPSSDPMTRARQMLTEHMGKLGEGKYAKSGADVTPPHGDTFAAQLSAHMAKLGRKGGQASGAKRMDMPKRLRIEIARKGGLAKAAKKGPERS